MVVVILSATICLAEQPIDWESVKAMEPLTWILVRTQTETLCSLQALTETELVCRTSARTTSAGHLRGKEIRFQRRDIREVRIAGEGDTYDYTKGFLSLLLAAGGGGEWDAAKQPESFAGVKIGGPFALDLQYDRIKGHSGFSTEGSAVIPLFRFPRFNIGEDSNFIKFYTEPGVGYRAGDGPFGGYTSAKVLVLLTKRWDQGTPYVEFQRRFPFSSPLDGDSRISIGIMLAVCEHCGLD